MLYKGADLIRDVEFVIFDEVHYVNDAEVSDPATRFFPLTAQNYAARRSLGRSYNHVAGSRQHHSSLRYRPKYEGVRRVGGVR